MNTNDRIIVTVLDDGTVKMECPDSISAANHGTAEAAIGMIARELGGKSETTRLPNAHRHSHAHAHTRGAADQK